MMRDVIARAVTALLTRRRDHDDLARARAEADRAKRQAAGDAALIRDARDVAARLAHHRARNHFAARMQAAFTDEGRGQ